MQVCHLIQKLRVGGHAIATSASARLHAEQTNAVGGSLGIAGSTDSSQPRASTGLSQDKK